MVALPRASALTFAAAPRGAWLFSCLRELPTPAYAVWQVFRNAFLKDQRSDVLSVRSHATRANKAITERLRQKASKQRLVCAARCAHSPYRRAQRSMEISALRATLCSSLLQASGRSCKYLQQANAEAAAPPRQPHRSPRRGPGALRRQRRLAPRATARAPVAPRSPHG